MNILDGVKNFLQIIEANWLTILTIIGIIVGLVEKTKAYFIKTKEEKYKVAKQQIKEIILEIVTKAENAFAEWDNAGAIKRSQVIKEIYTQYPILSKFINQEDIIAWIDEEINNSLKILKNVVKENQIKK